MRSLLLCFVHCDVFVGRWSCSGLGDACHDDYLMNCIVEQSMFLLKLVYDHIVKQFVEQSMLLGDLQCHLYVLVIVFVVY